ncbi:hypothetical protein [Pseudovibrio exalbescens]|uniref:hypothetical protein n=1 Tax=Pseudovibrio exalbescens TaxID=197461 RepID=UPI000C9C3CC7|nr:hypothetical protein [Pseudovibrio exalbescens]
MKDIGDAVMLAEHFRVKIIPDKQRPCLDHDAPQQMSAILTLQKILTREGAQHAWSVMFAITSIKNRPKWISQALIVAVSRVLKNNKDMSEQLGTFCDALETIEIPLMMKRSGIISGKRAAAALEVLIADRALQYFRPELAA